MLDKLEAEAVALGLTTGQIDEYREQLYWLVKWAVKAVKVREMGWSPVAWNPDYPRHLLVDTGAERLVLVVLFDDRDAAS